MKTLDPLVLSSLTRSQLRHRRRKHLDSARGQRRAIHAWRREQKTPEGKRRMVEALRAFEADPGALARMVAGSGASSDTAREAAQQAIRTLRAQFGPNRATRRAKATRKP